MSIFESSTPTLRRLKLGLASAGLLAVGAVAGGAVAHEFRPPIEMAPTHIVAIGKLASSSGIVTIKGRVAESFGNRVVLDDGSGRALIDAGPRGESSELMPLGATVSVQGRFERSSFHPSFLVDQTGTVTPLGPPPGHHHGPHGGPGRDEDGPHGPDRAPPPPAGPAPAAAAAAG